MLGQLKSKKHLLSIIFPVAIGIVYLIFALWNISGSIWFDEAYSSYIIRGDFAEIWSLTATDVHPPLYYFLLKVWVHIFGNADYTMRFMSVFFGLVAIVLAFQLVKRWFGIKTAVVATLCLAVSPIFIRYGQEARMYTLVLCIVLAATYALDLALTSKQKRYYILYAVLLALGMYTHYFVALAWLAHLLYIVFMMDRSIFEKPIFLTYLLAVALYLPWLPNFISQVTTVEGGFWIPAVTIMTPVEYTTQGLIYSDAASVNNWLVVLVLALVISMIVLTARVARRLKGAERRHLNLLTLLTLAPPVMLLLLSLPPLKPMFVDRYTIYSLCFAWILIGVVLALYTKQHSADMIEVKHPRRFSIKIEISFAPITGSAILLAAATIAAVVGITNVEYRQPKGYVKDIISLVQQSSSEGEAIFTKDVWTFYDAVAYSNAEHPVYTDLEHASSLPYGSMDPILQLRVNAVDDVSEVTDGAESFWYVVPMDTDDAKERWFTEGAGEDLTLADVKLPVDGKKWRVANTITTDHHAALELVRDI